MFVTATPLEVAAAAQRRREIEECWAQRPYRDSHQDTTRPEPKPTKREKKRPTAAQLADLHDGHMPKGKLKGIAWTRKEHQLLREIKRRKRNKQHRANLRLAG